MYHLPVAGMATEQYALDVYGTNNHSFTKYQKQERVVTYGTSNYNASAQQAKLIVLWTFGLNVANLSKNIINHTTGLMFRSQNFTRNPFMTSKYPYIGNNLIFRRLLTQT